MAGRSGFGQWNKKTGEFVWKDSVMPVGPQRARRAGLPLNLRLYTVREVAVVLRHSIYWVRDQIKAGRIKAIKLGNGYFITVLELARIMGETGTRRGRVCGNGSEGSGLTISKHSADKTTPANSTNGKEIARESCGVNAAARSLRNSPSTQSRTATDNRPLITSPGK